MRSRNKIMIPIILSLLLFFNACITSSPSNSTSTTNVNNIVESATEFQLIQQAWNLTQQYYVDKNATQPQRLAYDTIAGMIDSLGDTGHSTFLTPDEVKQQNDFTQGKLEGIGVEVQWKNNNVVIVAPIASSPAQKAGLVSGDIILKVNGQSITSVSDAVSRILGPAGTSVTLTIQSVSGATRDVTIVRATINLVSVTWYQLPGTTVAHLRISSFIKGTSSGLDNALTEMKAKGATAIIFDLRDNPGGLLDEAVSVASRFLNSGNVLLEKDASGNITPVPVIHGATVTNLPVVVLINQGTASAAEIVAGALHDASRAELVGETTFGTGTVLEQFTLSDGSALLLAVQEWLTPAGKTIWHMGLTPDKVVPLPMSVTPLSPETEQGMTSAQLQDSGDQQLLDALNLISTQK